MGAPKKADWREERRKRAREPKQADIAYLLGVTEGVVSQWLKKAREGGAEALKAHSALEPSRVSRQSNNHTAQPCW